MQAWILYMIYGVYAGEAAQFRTAREMLRQIVDVGPAFPSFYSFLPRVCLLNLGGTRGRPLSSRDCHARVTVLAV